MIISFIIWCLFVIIGCWLFEIFEIVWWLFGLSYLRLFVIISEKIELFLIILWLFFIFHNYLNHYSMIIFDYSDLIIWIIHDYSFMIILHYS